MSSTVSSRRPSLAILYNNLKAQSDPYEELENAAHLFPMEDDEEKTYIVPSVASSYTPSPSPPFENDDSDSETDSSSSDSDSDVEPMDLNATDAYRADSVMIYSDTPFTPPGARRQSPIITQTFVETAPSPARKPVSRKAPPITRAAPPPVLRSRKRKRVARSSVADEDSDRGADDCESIADASDDEYVPSPRPNPRKRTRSASPLPFYRTSTLPLASVSSASKRPSKRAPARLPPPSRNRQATVAELQSTDISDDFTDFTCPVCGWVQKNERLPDFKRHVKTHQRASDENAQKAWRCKGVLVSEAADWGLGADAETYTFLDQERVGGCMKTFSRRDALKRHLDNCNVSCVGRPTAPTED
ncbi:hypothetical protein MVEN_00375100 [Mycena venus]|uniref:C2H2-type domain-containing protein n=1 Tax=Mycena venus TaxID=2733690 RepID=A0A8H6YPV4_9AGAR|nr:hypothetical protein MVEN_00375100 [Mycena venus]